MVNAAKILIFDIETAPVLAYVWGLKDQNVAVNQINRDWYVIAWAAKWFGQSEVIYRDQRHAKNIEDDRKILRDLWKLLDEADIVITQNGKNFDTPKLNARFIEHGMKPPSPYKHLDTYQIARNAAKFTSNKLEYLTEKLCTKYKKLKHEKFPGFALWAECLKGNMAAWNEMRRYNKHDVLATEELYMKIRAWAPQNAPRAFNIGHLTQQCPTCGVVGKLRPKGYNYTRVSRFRKYVCKGCGSWVTGMREAL
jgi:uncharacterized protein YprB with RNaseH-like and TPR domain